VTEIGVLPEFEKTGLILALFNEFYKSIHTKYPKADTLASSWIYDENHKSAKTVAHFLKNKNKGFTSYEADI
jgi:hypothetical protein